MTFVFWVLSVDTIKNETDPRFIRVGNANKKNMFLRILFPLSDIEQCYIEVTKRNFYHKRSFFFVVAFAEFPSEVIDTQLWNFSPIFKFVLGCFYFNLANEHAFNFFAEDSLFLVSNQESLLIKHLMNWYFFNIIFKE